MRTFATLNSSNTIRILNPVKPKMHFKPLEESYIVCKSPCPICKVRLPIIIDELVKEILNGKKNENG